MHVLLVAVACSLGIFVLYMQMPGYADCWLLGGNDHRKTGQKIRNVFQLQQIIRKAQSTVLLEGLILYIQTCLYDYS